MSEKKTSRLWLFPLVLVLLVAAFFAFRSYRSKQKLAAQKAHSESVFAPALEKMTTPDIEAVDIDKTIRVMHDLDLKIKNATSLEGHLKDVAFEDYSGVPKDLLQKRRDILTLLQKLYATQSEQEKQEAFWRQTQEFLLAAASVVNSDSTSVIPVAIDGKRARELLEERRAEWNKQKELLSEINAIEEQLFEKLSNYNEAYYKVLKEWDALCEQRDKAYLATYAGDREAALAASSKAIEMAPQEREAHLLKALALIEGAAHRFGAEHQNTNFSEAAALIDGYKKNHPSHTAPAFLLEGLLHEARGDNEAARLAFQQSSAYFPKQAKGLSDMLNPYRMRSFLRKSREGNYILEVYKATMLGAGLFSPDLQMARMHFEAGTASEDKKGREKLLDHFSRRRAQNQWDFLIADLEYAQNTLGAHFDKIFPQSSYLDLVPSESLIGDALSVTVKNRGTKTLHNAALVLCLQLTDMHRNDYETFSAKKTLPEVPAGKDTDFGKIDIELSLFGEKKGVDDIVHHRAILIADEGVMWIDTQKYKVAQFLAQKEKVANVAPESVQGMSAKDDKTPTRAWYEAFGKTPQGIAKDIEKAAKAEVVKRLMSKDLVVELPKELAILRPFFRLATQEGEKAPKTDEIVGDVIRLVFDGAGDALQEGAELSVGGEKFDAKVKFKDGGVSVRLR